MSRNEVILLVEDNPDDEFLTKRALRRGRVANSILVARDGEEALDMLLGRGLWEGKPVRPSVLLLDLKLPKIDGLDVLRRVRAEPSIHRMPVVILTSSREDEDLLASYDIGANSYVVKPVDTKQFESAVKQLGLYWMVVNETPIEDSA